MGRESVIIKERDELLVDLEQGEVLPKGRLVWFPDQPNTSLEKGRDFFLGYQSGFEKLALDKSISGRPQRVLLLLFSRLNYENYILISHAEIGRILGIQRSHVSECFKMLTERGILDAGPKSGRNSTYRLNPEYAWKGSEKNRKEDLKRRMSERGLSLVESE